jgi:hypothetical protein
MESRLSASEAGLAALAAGEVASDPINQMLLTELAKVSRRAADLERTQEELILFVQAALVTLKAEPGLEAEFRRKAAVAKESVRALRDTGSLMPVGKGTLLSVNSDLGVVAITLGYADGVKQGEEWAVVHAGRRIANLRILSVRQTLSLATVTEGELQSLPLGAAVEKTK